MKACTNCKHSWTLSVLGGPYIPPSWTGPRCTHPMRKKADPVYGVVQGWRNCAEARADEQDCGPRGELFEPKLRHRIITGLFGKSPD